MDVAKPAGTQRVSDPIVKPRPAADVLDELGDRAQCCELQLAHFGGRRLFAGLVVTVRCHEDNALVRVRLSEPGAGRVLVVDGGGSLRCALLGEALAHLGNENGWAGVIVNGAVRDVAALRNIDLGVCALGTSPRRSDKAGRGESNTSVVFGGATFSPGGTVYCDDDGVVIARA